MQGTSTQVSTKSLEQRRINSAPLACHWTHVKLPWILQRQPRYPTEQEKASLDPGIATKTPALRYTAAVEAGKTQEDVFPRVPLQPGCGIALGPAKATLLAPGQHCPVAELGIAPQHRTTYCMAFIATS